VQAANGHYPGAGSTVKRMIIGKALLAALPLALGGGWLVLASNARIGTLRLELDSLETQGREEGQSFVRTLQGAHAERQLEILSRQHDAALQLAAARRNRLLGLILILFSGLAFAFVRAAQRVAAEIEEDGQLFERQRAGRNGKTRPP
jgi:hypothetical protein